MLWYRNVRNQIASNVWESHNPVHKFTTNKPQMMLINVLIGAFLNAKVLWCSAAKRLKYSVVFSDLTTSK